MRLWFRDLGMGTRFALTGGREGWIRTALTAIGVGLGVAMLLLTTAIPSALTARDDRGSNREEAFLTVDAPGPRTLLIAHADTEYRGKEIRGRILAAEGPEAPTPPGLRRIPAAGEMVVSPALADLLDSHDGRLLRERFPYRTVATIGRQGLVGPDDLAYYAGSDRLDPESYAIRRIDGFGNDLETEALDPQLLLLILVMLVVLLMPVAVLITTAVRFGGERRDRRLAAMRLIGADSATTRRIAAGEALSAALIGLVLGAGFFLAGRRLAPVAEKFDISLFPSDLDPSVPLALVVLLAVPSAAVGITLLALRSVVIEPLGVVRTAPLARRRLWWRVVPPIAGLALLSPMIARGTYNGANQWQVVVGTMLLLIGVTALLPWIVESAVNRFGGRGGLSWQLAIRRLQLGSEGATRSVNGIAVAVAGAIALQMLFTGSEGGFTHVTGQDTGRAQMSIMADSGADADGVAEVTDAIHGTEGVRSTTTYASTVLFERADDPRQTASLTIGTCDALREVAHLDRCAEGDTFIIEGRPSAPLSPLSEAGRGVVIDGAFVGTETLPGTAWRIPAKSPVVAARTDPGGELREGVLATPSALPKTALTHLTYSIDVVLDPSVRDAKDRVRNTVARIDPLLGVADLRETFESKRFANLRSALVVGTAVVLLMIGASLLMSTLEQLRERKRLLSVLIAVGTKRSTLGCSILYQTAIPVVLGLVLAVVTGVGLGAVLLAMVGHPFVVHWSGIAAMTGIGAAVVSTVTLLSLPALWHMTRSDGLRTE